MQIELSRLSKKYDGSKALDDVSLVIDPGQIVALIGLNGAGKTTLLRCLGGIVAPSQALYGWAWGRGWFDLIAKVK